MNRNRASVWFLMGVVAFIWIAFEIALRSL